MASLRITVKDAEGGAVSGALVKVKAIGSGNEPVYESGSGALVKEAVDHTDATGLVTFTLTANASLIPSESYYRVTIQAPSERKARVVDVQIPLGAGPFDLEDVLHDPGTIETSALAAHKLSLGDHGDVDLTGNATGKVLMWDGTNYVPADTHATDLEVSSAILVETNARTAADSALQADVDSKETPAGAQEKVDALPDTANTFTAEQTFTGDVGFGQAPGGFDFLVKANARFVQKGAGQSAVIIRRAFDPGDPEFFAGDAILMGMNSDYSDEQWRFDAEGNFKVVDIDGDNVITLKRDDDSVHLQVTRSTGGANAIILSVAGEATNRFVLQSDGKLLFGGGVDAPDVDFSRSAVNTLKSSNHLETGQDMFVGRQLVVGSTTAAVADSVNLIAGVGRGGRMLLSDVLTNTATKTMRIGAYHYTNAEEPLFAFFASSSSTVNTVGIGGGSSLGNAATVLDFYTAADNVTTTGTKRLTIDSLGRFGVHNVPSGNYNFRVIPINAGYAGMTVRQAVSQTASLLTVEDTSNAVLSRFDKNGYFMTRKTSIPADVDIASGEMALWFDSTAGAAKLKIKAKDAGGTVRTGEVALA